MKKFIVFAVVFALLVPAAAFAATEFSLGGFIKLDAMWDSNNTVGKNIYQAPARNNDGGANHGRLKMTAQGSRFNFTIKGPKLWGADVTGFMEVDFDTADNGVSGTSASQSYTPRLRHAMFRFNWPTSELLLGQYFSMFSEWYAESAEDGPMQMTGTPTARLAQIRFSQKFLGDWTVAGLVGNPNNTALSVTNFYDNASYNNGQYAETPQIQGKVQYQHDFWGKAAYYGKPIPFTAQIVAGWQRNIQRGSSFATATLNGPTGAFPLGGFASGVDGANYGTGIINVQNQYVNPWLLMGSLFIPVIPTNSANLAGTAHILTNFWVGQGVDAFGFTGEQGASLTGANLYQLDNRRFGGQNYSAQLLKKFGLMVEGQYYFNNQWFFNAVYGMSKAYGVSRARSNWIPGTSGINGMEWAMNGDIPQTVQQVNATLWYRPIQAIKFGLQYSYACATYFQYLNPQNNATLPAGWVAPNNVNRSHFGDDHRVEFVGFFYF